MFVIAEACEFGHGGRGEVLLLLLLFFEEADPVVGTVALDEVIVDLNGEYAGDEGRGKSVALWWGKSEIE